MDRRVAAVSYIMAVLIGFAVAFLWGPGISPTLPPPHDEEAVAVLFFPLGVAGAIFGFVFPKSRWVVSGVCLGSPLFFMSLFGWRWADPTPISIKDILLLATPMFAACIGAYAGAWLARRREAMRESRAKDERLMDRRVAAVSYIVAVLIGFAVPFLLGPITLLIVPPGPSPIPSELFLAVWSFPLAVVGAIFGFVFPKSSWVVSGVCLGGPAWFMSLCSWQFSDPTPMSLKDILLLAMPVFAACIGAYAGARIRLRGG